MVHKWFETKRVIAALLLLCPASALRGQPAPVIDGKLDDALWQRTPAHRLEPTQAGVPAEMGGEVRAVVRGKFLLVSARLPEPTGRVTARVAGQHVNWEDEDLLEITAGPDIGFTDRVVRVNPFGAFTIEREGQEMYANTHRYFIAAAMGDREWSVEAALPLSEMHAPGQDPILFSVRRIRAMRHGSPQQRWRWPVFDPAAKAAVDSSVPWDAPLPVYRPAPMGNRETPLEAGRAALPPPSAGWDDPGWKPVPAWPLARNIPGGAAPFFRTEVKAIHDGKTLAVLARCEEPGALVGSVKEHDGRVERDDSFHVYLGASGSAWAQISINVLGSLHDAAGKTGGPRISRPRADWESGATVAVRRGQGFWTARIDIPLERVLNILGEPASQTELRALFARVRPGRAGSLSETSALPLMPGQTMLAPVRYRRLLLSSNGPGTLVSPVAPPAPAAFETRIWSSADRAARKPAGMVQANLRARVQKALEAEAKAYRSIGNREQWEKYRTTRLEALRRSLGEFPARVPLEASVGKEYRGDGYRRLDIVYRSRPGLWIAANLYLPEAPRGRIPGIVIIPSHHRPRTQLELQDMGILWARSGSAVLVADNPGEGERVETYPWHREGYHSRYNLGLQLYLAGESLMKWMVWDQMRSIDLLLERPEIDPAKIVLLGAVAGGGDPAAVTAALDPRVAAVAPFTYGEATPENAGRADWPAGLADPGWGSWESTRNLPRSIAEQFLPWFICASVAPRRFVFSYEMGWEVEKQPVWKRYRAIFGFYNALDNLDEAHGFGPFPGPGECVNIGQAQRKTLYPELERWFGISPPAREPDDRRPDSELLAYSPELARKVQSRPIAELALEIARVRLRTVRSTLAALEPAARLAWLRREWARRLGDVEPAPAARATAHGTRSIEGASVEAVALDAGEGIAIPLLLIKPAGGAARRGVVVALSHAGKEGLVRDRYADIAKLLRSGVTVCLPDVRGIGETAPDQRRGPSSAEVSQHATELMLGSSLLGRRVADVRTVLAYLRTRGDVDGGRIALWGDSEAPANPPRLLLDESPGWQVGPDVQHESDPLGGFLALLTALFENNVRAVATRGALASFESVFADAFPYVPGHVVVPDMLSAGDVPDVAAALSGTAVLLKSPVDGKNRTAPEAPDASPVVDLAGWLAQRLAI